GARIFGSYIFSDVIVGKNSKIKNSIVGFRARILDNVVIERGCMIGDDVVIGPNVRIPPFTKIGATRKKTQATIEEFGDDVLLQPHSEGDIGSRQQQTPQVVSMGDYDIELIGVNGKGYNWGTTTRAAAPGSPSGAVGGGVNNNDDDEEEEEEWADQYELANKRLHYMAVTLKDIGIDLDEA
ncbi:translation initiation factor eIF-2B epsilon subunit, GEF, partial [Spiromyces aspiralis]